MGKLKKPYKIPYRTKLTIKKYVEDFNIRIGSRKELLELKKTINVETNNRQ